MTEEGVLDFESLVTAVDLWLADLGLEYAKMPWQVRRKEARRMVTEAITAYASKPESLAVGWAMPEKKYYVGRSEVPGPSGFREAITERQVRVYLDRASRGSRPVTIVEREV